MVQTRQSILLAIVAVGLTTSILHLLAVQYYLYWTLAWFDVLMHFLGGVLVGLVASWALFQLHRRGDINLKQSIALALLSVLFIGIGWELFEAVTKTTGVIPGDSYVNDTMLDLVMDILGGALAADLSFNRFYVRS